MNSTATLRVSQPRLARRLAWVRLWLQAFAAAFLVLSATDMASARRALQRTARIVAGLVSFHASARQTWMRRRPRRKPLLPRAGMRRTFYGSALRGRLRGRDLATQFFAILTVMRDFDKIVARQAKRLRRGLTRLRPIELAPQSAPVTLSAVACKITPANSS
ncbi:MAG: hypothetical protein QM759_01315 [Terricaulis sp.]